MKDKPHAVAHWEIPAGLEWIVHAVRLSQLCRAERALDEAHASLLSFELRYSQSVLRKYGELQELREREGGVAEGGAWEPPEEEEPTAQPDPMLRELFRELARMAHPDHAASPADERRRQKVMAAASAAMHNGDLATLEQLLREWGDSPGEPGLLQSIRSLEHRLYHCAMRNSKLEGSSMWGLMKMEGRLQAEGRDMLQEMAAVVQSRIDALREHR